MKKLTDEERKERIKLRGKRYREAHREDLIAKKKAYYETHKEQVLEAQKNYKETHKEIESKRAREYYKEHRDEIIKKVKAYRKENDVKEAARHKAYYEEHKEQILVRQRNYRKTNLQAVLCRTNKNHDIERFGGNRQQALECDSFACVTCGSTENLCIHHKDGSGGQGEQTNNNMDNLVTLCNSCHMLLHNGKGERWARKYDCCIKCGTVDIKYGGLGLCGNCYMRNWRKIKKKIQTLKLEIYCVELAGQIPDQPQKNLKF